MSTDVDIPWWIQLIVAPALSGLILGASGSYIGVQTAMSRYDERISDVRERTADNRKRIQRNAERIRELQSLVDSRLTRLETKINLLLNNKLDVSTKGGKSRDTDSP